VLAQQLDSANRALVQLKRQLQDGQPHSVVAKTFEKMEELLAASGASLIERHCRVRSRVASLNGAGAITQNRRAECPRWAAHSIEGGACTLQRIVRNIEGENLFVGVGSVA
jgi:hypothetical protein